MSILHEPHETGCNCRLCVELRTIKVKATKLSDQMFDASEAGKNEEANQLFIELGTTNSRIRDIEAELVNRAVAN